MKLNNRKYMMLTSMSILAACNSGTETKKISPQSETQKPNIIFVMCDDHAVQAISSLGGNILQTPNIDRIAKNGVVCKNSFVSNSISAPSRAVMLTGKHSHINGQTDNSKVFDNTQQTFPKLLQKAGYQTALVGKWHLRSKPVGFDYWNILPGQGQYYNPDFIEMGKKTKREGYVTNLTTQYGIDWIKQRDTTKPFCLLLHQKAPHRCWMPDTTHFDKLDSVKFDIPPTFYDEYKNRKAAGLQRMHIFKDMDMAWDMKMIDEEGEIKANYREMFLAHYNRMNEKQKAAWDKEYKPIIEEFKKSNLSGQELAEWKFQRYMQDYLRCVMSVDDNVGKLLDFLDESGLAENTLVVYTSDQGFYLGEHGWFDKRFMYEESMRTPLLIQYPKSIKKGSVVEELVQNIDFAPTFLEYAGVEIPKDIQGKSLKPLLEGTAKEWRKSLYYHYYEHPSEHSVNKHYGIRTERYKLIRFYGDFDDWEFYDLKNDPEEMNNIYDENNETVKKLKKKLKELRTEYNDTTGNCKL